MAPKEVFKAVDRSALDRLNRYVSLLGKWRKVTNLIADDSFSHVWQRHIMDAIHLQRQRPQAKCWVDIGSGAGLPSAVIAILLAGIHEAQIHCIEIDRRKCSFLREVASELALPMKVHNILAEDIGEFDSLPVEVVTARAFSTIERILQISHRFLSNGAVAVLPRGRQAPEEVARLDHHRYTVVAVPNPSSGDGVFVSVKLRASQFK